MTSNGVIAIILRYFTEFDSFAGRLRHSGRPIMSAKHRLPSGYKWTKLVAQAAVARSLCGS